MWKQENGFPVMVFFYNRSPKTTYRMHPAALHSMDITTNYLAKLGISWFDRWSMWMKYVWRL